MFQGILIYSERIKVPFRLYSLDAIVLIHLVLNIILSYEIKVSDTCLLYFSTYGICPNNRTET